VADAPVFIRTATKRDIPAIQALLREVWHATYDPIFGSDVVAAISGAWHSQQALSEKLSFPASEFILADDGQMIHAMAFASQIEKTVQLHQMYVLPGSQGRGIGTELMQELFFCFDSASRMELNVHPQNLNAIGFYKAGGFTETGKIEVPGPNGMVIPHIVMARDLDH
jgi:ribosomal protein S18 acetylase RimI-like enzyme